MEEKCDKVIASIHKLQTELYELAVEQCRHEQVDNVQTIANEINRLDSMLRSWRRRGILPIAP